MKKLIALVLAALLLGLALAACTAKEPAAEDKTIKIAATSTPHAEILEQCKPILAEQGYTLEIEVMDDYITPNTATDGGDVDANYFQHQPYLDQFNEQNGTKLNPVVKVHYEPYGIYAGTCKALADLEDGAVICVPNDATNEARALLLLADNGLIEVKEGAGLTATKNDITANPKNLDIREMEAALLPGMLEDAALCVINGNYALAAGLNVKNALASEKVESEAAQTFANVIVVKEGNENLEKIQALVKAATSEAIRTYINDTYDGAVVPMF